VAIIDQAHKDREYMHTAEGKQPELAALLEQLELELPMPVTSAQHLQLGGSPDYPWAGCVSTVA
jgi:hypothetical protein